MRNVIPMQLQLGETDIADIQFDHRSRDDVPQLLQGLQYLYTDKTLRDEIFSALEGLVSDDIDAKVGRPGMHLWQILVMGSLRLNLNWDYDHLLEMVNNHKTIRQMLGHGIRDDEDQYRLQTLKDNISLFTPKILDELNQIIVKAGHKVLKKKDENLKGRCDSFVVKTDVHFPTDISLLSDAIRKVVTLTADLSRSFEQTIWRQSEFNLRQNKKLYRKIQNMKHSTSKDINKQTQQQNAITLAYRDFIKNSEELLEKSSATLELMGHQTSESIIDKEHLIERYIIHAKRQIDQIKTRVMNDVKIPHSEKVFSIFEEHTEWICKGKAGVPVELGLRVCIVEDEFGFILHHNVMRKKTDNQITVSIIEETQSRFQGFNGCSFDKGFHSPDNQKQLKELLDFPVLPKKGKRNKEEQERESDKAFKASRRQHSAVESAINALEVHGLDKCPDHGVDGFERYIALAVISRNIQKLGAEIRKQEREAERKRRRKKQNLAA